MLALCECGGLFIFDFNVHRNTAEKIIDRNVKTIGKAYQSLFVWKMISRFVSGKRDARNVNHVGKLFLR